MGESIYLEARNISYSYSKGAPIFRNISFRLEPGKIVSILGPNGAGKTTLLNCLADLIPPDSGEILLSGTPISKMSNRDIAKTIGYVPQIIVPTFSFSVLEYVVTGCAPHMKTFEKPKEEHYDIAMDAIKRMGIEKLANRSYANISGGERQQVSIARALAQRPAIILMDEPTAHLDYGNQINVLKTISRLKEEGLGVVLTTHNPDHALLLRGEVAILSRDGTLQTGACDEILNEENLSALYGTELKLIYEDSLRREVCAAPLFN